MAAVVVMVVVVAMVMVVRSRQFGVMAETLGLGYSFTSSEIH